MYYLGVDAGGTSCRCRIIDQNDKIMGEGKSGPANYRLGRAEVLDTVCKAINRALKAAHLTQADLQDSAITIGMAGIERLDGSAPFAADTLGCAKVSVLNDGQIANLGSHAGQDGGTVIVGTGSIGILKIADNWSRIGGHGFPVSDEGSGAHIGLMAVSRMLKWVDGLAPRSTLVEEIYEGFEEDIARTHTWLDTATPTIFGTFAPKVVQHAEQGDENAVQIMQNAAIAIERFIQELAVRGAPRISLQGGLAPIITPWLAIESSQTLSPAKGDPLSGALYVAKLL